MLIYRSVCLGFIGYCRNARLRNWFYNLMKGYKRRNQEKSLFSWLKFYTMRTICLLAGLVLLSVAAVEQDGVKKEGGGLNSEVITKLLGRRRRSIGTGGNGSVGGSTLLGRRRRDAPVLKFTSPREKRSPIDDTNGSGGRVPSLLGRRRRDLNDPQVKPLEEHHLVRRRSINPSAIKS